MCYSLSVSVHNKENWPLILVIRQNGFSIFLTANNIIKWIYITNEFGLFTKDKRERIKFIYREIEITED